MAKRNHNNTNFDPATVANNSYNDYAGSTKVSPVGHKLVPMQTAPETYSTSAAARVAVGKGVSLAVYNNDTAVAWVTTGDVTVTSQAGGTVQAATPAALTPFVGVAVAPNSWTYINTYDHSHVIASAATCLVYVIKDDTSVSN